MPTPLQQLEACKDGLIVVRDELDGILLQLNDAIIQLEFLPGPGPAPAPTTRRFRITVDKSLAYHFKRSNAKGKPIMVIYEDPRYIYGDKKKLPNINSGPIAVITLAAAIQADGSNPGPWFVIADKKGEAGEVLYIDSRDGRIE